MCSFFNSYLLTADTIETVVVHRFLIALAIVSSVTFKSRSIRLSTLSVLVRTCITAFTKGFGGRSTEIGPVVPARFTARRDSCFHDASRIEDPGDIYTREGISRGRSRASWL